MRSGPIATCAFLLLAASGVGEGQAHSMPMDSSEEPSESERSLFSSDMAEMTGMTPRDSMASMQEPGWRVMDLGVVRAVWNRQDGPSGGTEVESGNWNMLHVGTTLRDGRVSLMMMNSLEPATYPARGSRELFQTGEAYRGEPLVDRQHPHDFFMNLSATYRRNLGADAGAWVQVAPVGEPVSGPIAFMHRASAGENPAAPLGHHWQDSTHISFHVVTVGGGWKWITLEASVFRGREPDEHRWDIEGGRIDSAAARAKVAFGGDWSGEVSHAFLKTPEPLEPGNDHRTTAALYYGADGDRPVAATLLWGENNDASGRSESLLAEAAWQASSRDQVYGRLEWVEKDEDLLATKTTRGPAGPRRLARIGAWTAGYVRDFELIRGARTGVGADLTGYRVPSALDSVYGRSPLSAHVFARVRWGHSHFSAHAQHSGMQM